MPTDTNKQKVDTGKVLASWKFPEFNKYTRPHSWYMTAGTAVALLFIFSLATANLLFAIIIFFAVVIFIMNQRREPKTLTCQITEEGLLIDDLLYVWGEIKDFWIAYEPPHVKTLYFNFNTWHLPRLPIPLSEQDPVTLREMLLEYIDEDLEREGEPISDSIGRSLKLH